MIAYPSSLPAPQPGAFAPRPRRAASSIDGPLQQRARQRDAAGLTSEYTFVYTPDEMAAWRTWWRDVLLEGRRWFNMALPGQGGMVQRVVRYLEAPQQLLGAGIYRVSARFEQRGAAADVQREQVAFSVGQGLAPVLPTTPTPGDGLLMCLVVHYDETPVLVNPGAWIHVTEQGDSNAVWLKMHFYVRTADGTSDDGDTGFTVATPENAAWAICSIAAISDPEFPSSLADTSDYRRAAGLDVGLITKAAVADQVALAVGLIVIGPPGGNASFSAMPAGYTQLGETFGWDLGPVTAEVAFAFKLFNVQTENPGGFGDGGGLYGIGGVASACFVLSV